MRLATAKASCSLSTTPSEPGGVGTPAFLARARLTALSSSAFIARELGPMKRMLQQRPSVEPRSEEHTSELQSRLHLVCRLLLEKKIKKEQFDCGEHTSARV